MTRFPAPLSCSHHQGYRSAQGDIQVRKITQFKDLQGIFSTAQRQTPFRPSIPSNTGSVHSSKTVLGDTLITHIIHTFPKSSARAMPFCSSVMWLKRCDFVKSERWDVKQVRYHNHDEIKWSCQEDYYGELATDFVTTIHILLLLE